MLELSKLIIAFEIPFLLELGRQTWLEALKESLKKKKKGRRNLDFPLVQSSDTIIEVKWFKTVYVMLEAWLKVSGRACLSNDLAKSRGRKWGDLYTCTGDCTNVLE